MALPDALKEAIQKEISGVSLGQLSHAREELSERYRHRKGGMPSKHYRDAYITTRMPATYAVVESVLRSLAAFPCESVLDLGAGPGTATWAACSQFPQLKQATLMEQDADLIQLGKTLAKSAPFSVLQNAAWVQQNLSQPTTLPVHDLVILSYVIGELPHNVLHPLLQSAWEAARIALVVIEPGTPIGYQNILIARKHLIASNAQLLAPCPHSAPCPMEGTSNWCHFSQRLERSGEHRRTKQAALGYEDEKFSYVIGSRMPAKTPASRVVGHPLKRSGHVCLTLCTEQGIQQVTVSRKEGDLYRAAKKAEWGDGWPVY